MTAPKWSTPVYGCTQCRIGHFTATVALSTDRARPGYQVRFADVHLKRPIPDLEAAKAAALRLARRTLTEALAALGGGG